MSEQSTGGRDGAPPADTRSVNDLVDDAVADVRALVEQQKQLAQAEIAQAAARGGAGAGLVAAALTLLTFSTFPLVIAVAELLATTALPRWAAYLVTFGIIVVVALVLAGIGVLLLRRVGPPRRAIEAGRATVDEVRSRLSSLGRPRPTGAQPTEQGPTSTGAVPAVGSTASSSSTVRA